METEKGIMERKLYEASVRGNVQALDALMEEDELILDRVSLTCFDETPLHIAAMRGHLGLTKALLSRKPELASELDSLGRLPLHMACAAGHIGVARELRRANESVLGIRNGDGMTPLHVAAAKGRVEVVRELLTHERGVVELTQGGGGGGGSVLHLCVKYNRLEALKLVVEWIMSYDDGQDFVNSRDRDGNTILHLATALKQMETIEYLLQFSSVKEATNAKNQNGFTALGVLELSPIRDLKSMEIQNILLNAGVQRAKPRLVCTTTTTTDHQHHHLSPAPIQNKSKARQMISNFWKNCFKIDDKWLEEACGNVIMSATVIAAMAFQAGVSPPGSIWQDYKNWNELISKDGIPQYPGKSIAGSYIASYYTTFSAYNRVSFMASLFTILLTISGIPLKNKVAIWLLMSAMCISVASMALAYLQSMRMVCPENTWDDIDRIYVASFYTWTGISALVMLIHDIRFFAWFFAWLRERRRGFLQKRSSSVTKRLEYGDPVVV